ncbi:MAG: aldose 1-epimerase family protein [Clostridiales bacterium]|jgi:galactose mutarotase-like enzyme|nr:aldose 1-epimerase family protein [Clostridiales bacterium]
MVYSLENGQIRLEVSSKGAEIMSLKKGGREYIWQGDARFWKDRAINLFPIVGRLWEGNYTYKGREYRMGIHGFAKDMEFELKKADENSLYFTLSDNEETRRVYPFGFELLITYTIDGSCAACKYHVANTGNEEMPFGIGGHPGFIFPPEGEAGEWFLEFEEGCRPEKVLLEDSFITGKTAGFPLREGSKILFDSATLTQFVDTIILRGAGQKVSLKSDKYPQKITVRYPGFKYIAFWKSAEQSPFLCIEPWHSLPSYCGKVDSLEGKRDMVLLNSGNSFKIGFEIEIE